MSKLCVICGKKHKARGYCASHYQNLKTTGNPLGKTGKPKKNNCIVSFIELVDSIPINQNGCKIWPLGINSQGYGNYSIDNMTYSVHRLLYTTVNNKSYYGFVVRHKCDNRACCNIDHLEIGTQSDNLMDASKRNRLRIGEDNNMAVLTEEQVLYLRSSYPNKSTWQLSKELGVSPDNISRAISGKTWKHLPGKKPIFSHNSAKGIKHHKCKLTQEQVIEMRRKYPKTTKAELAREYGISFANVRAIVNRTTWTHI